LSHQQVPATTTSQTASGQQQLQVCWLTPVMILKASSAEAMMHAPDISMTTYSIQLIISS
jgi:hypothetical protein